MESFERALALDAGTTEARVELARLYAEVGRMPDAVRVLARATQYEDEPALLLSIGRTFHEFGVYDRALDVTPDFAAALIRFDMPFVDRALF